MHDMKSQLQQAVPNVIPQRLDDEVFRQLETLQRRSDNRRKSFPSFEVAVQWDAYNSYKWKGSKAPERSWPYHCNYCGYVHLSLVDPMTKCFKSSPKGKVKFDSEADALASDAEHAKAYPGDAPKRAYPCPDETHWHLTTIYEPKLNTGVQLSPEEITGSKTMARVDYGKFENNAVYHRVRSTNDVIEKRRNRVLVVLNSPAANLKTYGELAAEVPTSGGTFSQDVKVLKAQGLYHGRNDYSEKSFATQSMPLRTMADAEAKKLSIDEQIAQLLAQKAQIDVTAAEIAEKHKLKLNWLFEDHVNYLLAQKNGVSVKFTVDVWDEIILAVSVKLKGIKDGTERLPTGNVMAA